MCSDVKEHRGRGEERKGLYQTRVYTHERQKRKGPEKQLDIEKEKDSEEFSKRPSHSSDTVGGKDKTTEDNFCFCPKTNRN